MNNIPNWWEFLLLALAAFRVFRLISEDTILDRPRAWLLGYGDWQEGQQLPKTYRAKWGEWVTCAWCCGAHISFAWWAAWIFWPHATTVAAVPWAISTIVALAAKNLDE